MPIDGLENAKLASQAAAVLFCDDHLDDLTTARHQLSQRLGLGVRDGPGGPANGFGDVSDRASKDARLFDGLCAAASSRSVLASLPVERAKSRI
jgi:hypothetical protein